MLLLLSIAVTVTGCEEDDDGPDDTATDCSPATHDENTLVILPLGDSRVDGARPDYESYRYELYKRFVENNQSVDFIGSRTDEADYAAVNEVCFDTDHEGTGGATTQDILATLQNTTFTKTPDVVTLGIGGNNLLQGQEVTETVANLNQVIDELQTLNPELVIFLEQIAPTLSTSEEAQLQDQLDTYNEQIPTVAAEQTADGHRVIVVDMASNWSDDYFADPVHYNEAGAAVVAERYHTAIVAEFFN